MQRSRNETLVITLGNPLMGEDAIGYKLFEMLKGKIKVKHLADIFRFSTAYEGEENVIFIDAVYSKKIPAGKIIYLKNEEIFSLLKDKCKDAHFLGVGEAIKILKETMKEFPKRIHFIGISCKNFEFGEMSEEVKEAFKKVVEIVVK
ncbi:MAG: hydrogenase maturation protease [Thermoplasmata archaeon]|nr:MAG: hydrogenase maturation protease [Thermoplasmata archaeon]